MSGKSRKIWFAKGYSTVKTVLFLVSAWLTPESCRHIIKTELVKIWTYEPFDLGVMRPVLVVLASLFIAEVKGVLLMPPGELRIVCKCGLIHTGTETICFKHDPVANRVKTYCRRCSRRIYLSRVTSNTTEHRKQFLNRRNHSLDN